MRATTKVLQIAVGLTFSWWLCCAVCWAFSVPWPLWKAALFCVVINVCQPSEKIWSRE